MTEETQSPITTEQPNFEQLLLLLKSKNKEGRCKAVNTMAESGDSRAVIALIEMLHDETPVVQYTAIWGLLKLEDKRAIPPLMAVLQNKRSVATSVRSQAAESLGELKAVQALELLCAVAEDSTEDLEVRQAALEGVSYFNEPQVDKLPLNCFLDKTIPTDLRYDAVGLLGELQVKGCFDMLVVALQDQSEPGEIRANAAYALGVLDDERALQPLLDALDNKDEEVRAWTTNALGHLGNKQAVPNLLKVLKYDQSNEVLKAAAYSLGELKDERAVEPLIEALKAKNWEVRWWVIGTLGDIGDELAIPPLTKALNDRSGTVIGWAAMNLEKISGTRIVPILEAILEKTSGSNKLSQRKRKALDKALTSIRDHYSNHG